MIMDYDTEAVSAYSKYLMDPETGISYEEPSPNAFSFNSPYGACPKCRGLGALTEVDMKLIIPDENLSINNQGIAPFGEVRDNITFKQLRAIAKKYNSLLPLCQRYSQEALEIILHGGKEAFPSNRQPKMNTILTI